MFSVTVTGIGTEPYPIDLSSSNGHIASFWALPEQDLFVTERRVGYADNVDTIHTVSHLVHRGQCEPFALPHSGNSTISSQGNPLIPSFARHETVYLRPEGSYIVRIVPVSKAKKAGTDELRGTYHRKWPAENRIR